MNNWDSNARTTVTRKSSTCTTCKGRGIEMTYIDTMYDHTVAFARDCTDCDGSGILTLEYRQCKCGKSQWMELEGTTCTTCIKVEIQEYFSSIMQS